MRAIVVGCVLGLLVGVAIGYGVWHQKAYVPPGRAIAGTPHPVSFVVLNGGGVFYVPQPGDVLSWYREGYDQTQPNEIAVTFPESPCSGSNLGKFEAVKECAIDKTITDGTPSFYAYDCSSASNLCQDPGISPGSKNLHSFGNGAAKTKPLDPDGNATLVTITCPSSGATVYPQARVAHVGDTITWLSNPLTWSITLPSNTTMCSEGVNLNNKNNVCNIVQVPPHNHLIYTAQISQGCPGTTPTSASGELIVTP